MSSKNINGQIRNSSSRAYDKWTESDDLLLKHEYLNGASIAQLSKLLHRQPGAIQSRIRKLGLVIADKRQKEEVDRDDENLLDLDIKFRWLAICCDEGKEYFFPEPLTRYMLENYRYPAIYRWIVYKDHRSKIHFAYIGTTKQLCPERLAGYLDPATSNTNLRLHQEFRQFAKQGYKIAMESLFIEDIKMNNLALKLNNLHSNTARVFIETLLISYYRQRGLALLNQ